MSAKYAILGAGNGGLSMAGDLVLKGFEVVGLYDKFSKPINDVLGKGGIELVGPVVEGFAKITNATTSVEEAIKDANIIMVVVPAFAHEYLANELAGCVKDDQVIMLSPGYFGGALLFQKIFKEKGVKAQVLIGESLILLYATRIISPATVGIRAIKKVLHVSALPASRNKELKELLEPAFPQVIEAENVIDTGMNNPNPIYHVAVALLNYPRVEQGEEKGHFDYHDWMSESVLTINDMIDEERLKVAKAIGVPPRSFQEFEAQSYGENKKVILAAEGEIPESSKSMPPRYITEDVPMALVPWSQLGKLTGVNTPIIDASITLSSAIKGINYFEDGRTLKYLGLDGKTAQEIIATVS